MTALSSGWISHCFCVFVNFYNPVGSKRFLFWWMTSSAYYSHLSVWYLYISLFIFSISFDNIKAPPYSSKRGVEIVYIGATYIFDIIILTSMKLFITRVNYPCRSNSFPVLENKFLFIDLIFLHICSSQLIRAIVLLFLSLELLANILYY